MRGARDTAALSPRQGSTGEKAGGGESPRAKARLIPRRSGAGRGPSREPEVHLVILALPRAEGLGQ